MSLDLETGSLLGFGSDWTTVGPSETSILAEIGMGQLGRSAPVKYWSCWLEDSGDGALKNGSLVSLRCLLFLLLVRPSSVWTWYDLTSTSCPQWLLAHLLEFLSGFISTTTAGYNLLSSFAPLL